MLRWHAVVRTLNGHITSYVRVKAPDAITAAKRAPKLAHRRNKGAEGHVAGQYQTYGVEHWFTIMVSLHPDDQNSIETRGDR